MAGLNAKAVGAFLIAVLLCWTVQASGESCMECHLHRSYAAQSGTAETKVETLAGFHGREFMSEGTEMACRKCHGGAEDARKPVASEVCIQCHTKGKAAQGDPRMVFHAEKDHWYMEKVSCAECHKGHVKGNPDIKFLTTDAIGVCRRCHEKSFDLGVSNKETPYKR